MPEKSVVQLVRKNSVQPLSAKWVLADPINGDGNISASTDSNINLGPTNLPTNLAWTVVSPIDVGGTLQVDIKFNKVKFRKFRFEFSYNLFFLMY